MKIFAKIFNISGRKVSTKIGHFMQKASAKSRIVDSIYSEYRTGVLRYTREKTRARIVNNKGWFKSNYAGVKGLAKSVGPIPFATAAAAGTAGMYIAPLVPGFAEVGLLAGIVLKKSLAKGVKVGARGINSIFK